MTRAYLRFTRLGTAGFERLQVKGLAAVAGALPILPLGVDTLGMRVQIVDLGSGGAAGAVVLDHRIPGGSVPTVCGARDGWRTNATGSVKTYLNANQRGATAS